MHGMTCCPSSSISSCTASESASATHLSMCFAPLQIMLCLAWYRLLSLLAVTIEHPSIGVCHSCYVPIRPLARPELRPQWLQLVSYMYNQLGETDIALAVHRRFALSPNTKIAIALENYGLVAQVPCASCYKCISAHDIVQTM